MGTQEDREHFKSYRPQTLVKHTIVEKYLPAYYDILKQTKQRLTYIDAFAGRGYYVDDNNRRQPGSPIRALQLLANNPRFRDLVVCVFSEPDEQNFAALQIAVSEFREKIPDVPEPLVVRMTFSQLVDQMKSAFGDDLERMAPGFLLVDPCGLRGASAEALCRILRMPYAEAFVFLNSAGLARVVGANLQNALSELFGDEDVAREAIEGVNQIENARGRERFLLKLYERQLRIMGQAEYLCSFRIEYEDRQATSHYLIHASKHRLAFKIMKDVMWGEGSGRALELQQASYDPNQAPLELGDADVDQDILERLRDGQRSVSYFTNEVALQPDNRIASKYYKKRLLHLEATSRIEVWRDGHPAPADSRRKRLGKPTLADSCEVRLRQ